MYEEGEWTDKGQYTAAVRFDEDIEWMREKREYILPVCYVNFLFDSLWFLLLTILFYL